MISPARASIKMRATRSGVARHARRGLPIGSAILVGLWLTLLGAAEVTGQPTPLQPGGGFGFSYPNFTGNAGDMDGAQFVTVFNGAHHNPNVYAQWIVNGTDIRVMNPNGMYMKHINLRTIESTQRAPSVEGHPNYAWIHANHPEWIVKDINGKSVPLFIATEEQLDFGNDAYLDWVLNTWMPNEYLDATDRDPNKVTWYLQDNGSFTGMRYTPNPSDPVSVRYSTDEGVRTAWEHMLARFKAKWPNKRIIVNTGPNTYQPIATQLPVLQRIMTAADGYFSEFLTNDLAWWDGQPNDGKRLALETTIQLASWLADNDKVFFPVLGQSTTTAPTQAQVNYGWAFFNLMRKGTLQFFSLVTKNAGGAWVPRSYPEMSLELGTPTEVATQQTAHVWRRDFTRAIAYVNLSDAAVTIPLPSTGGPYKNSLGQTVGPTLTLGSFSGLTVYKGVSKGESVPAAPTNLQVK